MMNKTLHSRDIIVRINVSRKEQRKGLANIKGSVDIFIWHRDDNGKKE